MTKDGFDGGGPPLPRRRLLQGLAGAGLAETAIAGLARAAPGAKEPGPAALDEALRHRIATIVVIYAENRSFNNLFADFPGLERPLASIRAEECRQVDRDGTALPVLPPVWGGMVPKAQIVDHHPMQILEKDLAPQANGPFRLVTPVGDPLPPGAITRDLVHAFYQNQMQINGGLNDGFVAWGDSGALPMGYYGDSSATLRLWQVARQFTLCDNFFMGAFGGSFLNHQYLVAAQPPRYSDAGRGPARTLIAELEGDDPAGTRLRTRPGSPVSALDGPPIFGPSALTPDFWVVNTMAPPYAPSAGHNPSDPALADRSLANVLPPQTHATIGDRLTDAKVDWAWYAGGWDLALAGDIGRPHLEFPVRPNFQMHHQPFNYFASLAPGTPERPLRLRDAGTGDSPRTNRFLADARAGRLPAVTYYKPEGDLNLHAGYADVESGDRHICRVLDALRQSPQWPTMLVIVTFDENGGWWDHVPPPPGDRWGPGSRIPALLVSPHVRKGHVDHTLYDTGSIARFIIRRFGLETLPGLRQREEAMTRRGGVAPGDLTAALDLAGPG